MIRDMVSRDVGKRIACYAGALQWHSVDCVRQGDRLMALGVATLQTPDGKRHQRNTWVDVTEWSMQEVYRWLGY